VYTGRLQQGIHSDPKATLEYNLCSTCFNQIKAEIIVSVMRKKNK
jgi:hypothetical protein